MTNLLLLTPDVPAAASTVTASASAATGYGLANICSGSRGDLFRLATAQSEDLWIEYDLGSGVTKSSNFLAISRAKLLKKAGITKVVLRGSSASITPPQTNLQFWLDAGRNVTYDASTLVSSVTERSANAYVLTQGTAANKPLLSRSDNKGNLTRQSRTPSNAAWTKSGTVAVDNAATNYDGTATGATITASAGTSLKEAKQSTAYTGGFVAGFAGASYKQTFFLKYSNTTYVWVGEEGDSSYHGANVNINAGTIQTTSSLTASSITSLGSGWYQVDITFTRIATGSISTDVAISQSGATAPPSITAAGTEQVYFGGVSTRMAAWDTTELVTTTNQEFAGVNGNRAFYCDGARKLIINPCPANLDLTGDFSMFFVVKNLAPLNDGTTNYGLCDTETLNSKGYIGRVTGNTGKMDFRTNQAAAFTQVTATNAISQGTTTIIECVKASTTGTQYMDGVANGTGTLNNAATTNNQFHCLSNLGAQGWKGYVCEILIYNDDLSASDRQSVENYLTAKYQGVASFQTMTLDTDTLYGPDAEDLVSAFTASTAYRYWWLQIGSAARQLTTASTFPFSKAYFGTSLDLGRDPIHERSSTTHVNEPGERRARNEARLEWEGVSDTNLASYLTRVMDVQDTEPVMLYDQGDYFLNDNRILHCEVTNSAAAPLTVNSNAISATFREVL